MSLKAQKELLDKDILTLQKALAKKQREKEKLDAVQTNPLEQEPVPGSVLMFSRHLAGSTHKYTFVVFRGHDSARSWVVTGRDNSLQLIGLKNSGNTWEEILYAAGSAKLKQAVSWAPYKGATYEYFIGRVTGSYYRGNVETDEIQVLSLGGNWNESNVSGLARARSARHAYVPITEDEALEAVRRYQSR